MRVCYFGTYRANYSRNQIMIEGLRQAGVEVIECHALLWHGIEDRVQAASRGWLRPKFLMRVFQTYWRLLRAYARLGDFDIMVLGYPGQLDVFLARVLTWLRRKPLVMDVFMSIYLVAAERGLVDRHPLTGRLIRWIEKLALRLPDLLIQDTAEYVQWFQKIYGLDPSRFRLVPTGADDRIFHPVEVERHNNGHFRVLYYGTFIPNHGVEHIVEAARILGNDPTIHFELVGEGPTKARVMALAEQYGLTNVTFTDWVDRQALPRKAAEVDVLLGVFGTTPQSMMTIQNKIYEGLAMARPVVTADSPTVRNAFKHGEDVYLCERANPQALAVAVQKLKTCPDLCEHIAERGYQAFQEQFALRHNGARFIAHLRTLAKRNDYDPPDFCYNS
jgi:glycosyltransferase involved in cell wall biosynthesis